MWLSSCLVSELVCRMRLVRNLLFSWLCRNLSFCVSVVFIDVVDLILI